MQKKYQDFINESESRVNPRKKLIDRQLAMSNKEIGNVSRFEKYQSDMQSDFKKVPMKKRAAMFDVYKKVYDLVMADPNLSARFQKDLKGMLDSDLNKKGIQEQNEQPTDQRLKNMLLQFGVEKNDVNVILKALQNGNEQVIANQKYRPAIMKLLQNFIQSLGSQSIARTKDLAKDAPAQSNNQ